MAENNENNANTMPGAQSAGGSGLTGDFNADVRKYFGVAAGSDAGSENGEKEQDVTPPARAADGGTDEGAASSGRTQDEDDDAAFDALIRGRYREQFGRRAQAIINERFKKAKETEVALTGQLEAYKALTAPLRERYGLAPDATPQALSQAMASDGSDGNAAGTGGGEALRRDEAVRETCARWEQEAQALRQTFPDFDLAREAQSNEAFCSALAAGLPVAQAFYGANFERISGRLLEAAARQAAKQTAATVAANRARPSEGGQAAGTGVKTGAPDVGRMTGEQVLDVLKKVEQGARICF